MYLNIAVKIIIQSQEINNSTKSLPVVVIAISCYIAFISLHLMLEIVTKIKTESFIEIEESQILP